MIEVDLDVAQRLKTTLDAMPSPLFVVADGASFGDLRPRLSALDLPGRPLYRERTDSRVRDDGPWLVPLVDRQAREHAERWAMEAPCLVFWSCVDGEEVLYPHLRSINMVRIAERRTGRHPDAFEWVVFRHADPNVLAQTLPAFDQAQFNRFLGPGSVVFLPADDYADRPGPLRARRQEGSLPVGTGPLTLDAETLGKIEQRRAAAIRAGIVRQLRESTPSDLGAFTEEEIRTAVARSEATAAELGIRSAENRRKWAWLDLASDGNFGRSQSVRDHVGRANADHDWDMDTLIGLTRREIGLDAR